MARELAKFDTAKPQGELAERERSLTPRSHGKFDKDKFSGTIEFTAGEGQESLVGKTFDFTCRGEANTWLHVGTIKVNDQDIKIDEKWERCK